MQCPACSKVFSGSGACPRCGCDTVVLGMIASHAEYTAKAAREKLSEGDFGAALAFASSSWELKKNQVAARVGLLACIGMNERKMALMWWKRADRCAIE